MSPHRLARAPGRDAGPAPCRRPRDPAATVLKSLAELEGLRSTWAALQSHPLPDFEYFRAVVEERPEVVRPHVVVLGRGDSTRTILVGRVERNRFSVPLWHWRIRALPATSLVIMYGGWMGAAGREEVEDVLACLRRSLRAGEFDLVHVHYVPTSSEIYSVLARDAARGLYRRVSPPNGHWQLSVPSTMAEFYGRFSRRRSRELRRISAKMERERPLAFRVLRDESDVVTLCESAEGVAKLSYLRGMGQGFYDSPEMRRRLCVAARAGRLRGSVLYVGDAPCAFDIGTVFGDTCFLNYTAFDPSLARFEPGTVLILRIIDALVREGRVRLLDFGLGDAFYKRKLCDVRWEESSIFLFGRGPRAALLAAVTAAAALAGYVGDRLVRATRLEMLARRLRRRRFTPRAAAPAGTEKAGAP